MLSIFNRIRWSPQNGLIVVSRAGEVSVKGYRQTSSVVTHFWEDAFTHLELDRSRVSRVLMLGLGGGGALPAIYAAYPQASVVVVEHDLRMVGIARGLRLYEPRPFPQVIVADAKDALLDLKETFDLIVIDLAYGNKPPPFLLGEEFWRICASRLLPGGTVAFNTVANAHFLELPNRLFAHTRSWRYNYNIFGAFWN